MIQGKNEDGSGHTYSKLQEKAIIYCTFMNTVQYKALSWALQKQALATSKQSRLSSLQAAKAPRY
jgi:hypothetical protein